jgi:hypothetical protein
MLRSGIILVPGQEKNSGRNLPGIIPQLGQILRINILLSSGTVSKLPCIGPAVESADFGLSESATRIYFQCRVLRKS